MSAQNKAKLPSPANAKPWSGRFGEPVTDLVKRFTASVGFDHRLAEFDIDYMVRRQEELYAELLKKKGIRQ